MTDNERLADALLKEAAMLETVYDARITPTTDVMEQAAEALKNSRLCVKALWKYHNDEHGVWWGCSNCGKIVHKPPHDKRYCSRCGAQMEREA